MAATPASMAEVDNGYVVCDNDGVNLDDLDTVRELIGDKVPTNAVPAAWWITTNPDQIAHYDQWVIDYDAHADRVRALADFLGVPLGSARVSSWGKSSRIVGFVPPVFMGHWNDEHEDYRPIPAGWRIDSKSGYLVPKRKTKADRESQANKDLAAIQKLPNVRSYMSGLPTEVYLDDRDMGGTAYGVGYRRGDACVWAYCNGDPDRQPEKRMNEAVDTAVWHRGKLSILVALQEEARARG